MPPRILALILTLVQSNRAILIGSLDSTAFAVIGVRAVAARAARPNRVLVMRNLLMDVFLFPGSRAGLLFLVWPAGCKCHGREPQVSMPNNKFRGILWI